jgi:hypothetical protein
MFKTQREMLYGGPLSRGKKYHYVTYLASEQVGNGETREESEKKAVETLLGAYRCQSTPVYASITADGHVVTTREYAPSQVEFSHHRDSDGRQGGSMMSTLELMDDSYTKRPVSITEFHAHYLNSYNESVTPQKEVA